ncbi:protein PBDC1 [Trichonephila clavipes]|nr:protein PBDC1 [Trichonephila clavipes]
MDAATTEPPKQNGMFDADSYMNNPELEIAWAQKAVEHMEIHFNLIISVPPEQLRLTPRDDEIYNAFIKEFPDFKLDVLDMESLKSEENKKVFVQYQVAFKRIL